MKDFLNKVRTTIAVWIVSKFKTSFFIKHFSGMVVEAFKTLSPKNVIDELYHKLADKDLILQEKVVVVRKGKVKYYLTVFETKHGKIVYNLGRYGDGKPMVSKNRTFVEPKAMAQ